MSKVSDGDYQRSKPHNKSNLFPKRITIDICLIIRTLVIGTC